MGLMDKAEPADAFIGFIIGTLFGLCLLMYKFISG
jgi:hypothetical protein